MTNIEIPQLKKLITDHSVRENLKALTKQNQLISDLAGKIRKTLGNLEENGTLDQAQLLKDLEQLRMAKHYMRGIRFVNFYKVLKGEEPRHTTTPPFNAEDWEEARAKKIAWIKEQKNKDSN
jgi:hypothetical protein